MRATHTFLTQSPEILTHMRPFITNLPFFWKLRLCSSKTLKTLLASTTAFCIKLATAIGGSGHYFGDIWWSLRRLVLSNTCSEGFYNHYHTKCWVKTSGKNKEIKWLNIVNFSLHATALSEDRLYAIFAPKKQGSQFADFICL